MTSPLAARAEHLIRSVAGVARARVQLGPDGAIRAVQVVAAPGAASRQVIRNTLTALKAGLRLALEAKVIELVDALPEPLPEPVRDLPAPTPSPRKREFATSRWGRGGSVRHVRGAAATGDARVVHVDTRCHDGGRARCRVIVELAGEEKTGTAELDEEKAGISQLAAQATLDAMRGFGRAGWEFDGAADVIIAGKRHVVVSVTPPGIRAALSGAAAVDDSLEHAVAVAVLRAAGLTAEVNNTRAGGSRRSVASR